MLSILDKYIIRKFLSTFFFMLGIIMLFAMVFDVSEKLSEFISNEAPVSAIIFEYYVSFFLFHGNMFSSMIVFISVIWFTAKLAQDTELVPMWFSGKPMLAVASNTAFYARELEKDIYAYPEQWLWIHRRFKGDRSPLREGEWIQGRARR